MTQQDWDKMTTAEQYNYLTSGAIEVQRKTGIKADSKPNDENSTVTVFAVVCTGIQMTGWCNTLEDALHDASANIAALSV